MTHMPNADLGKPTATRPEFWGKPGVFSIIRLWMPKKSKIPFNECFLPAAQLRWSVLCCANHFCLCTGTHKGILLTTLHFPPDRKHLWWLLLLPMPVSENDTDCQMLLQLSFAFAGPGNEGKSGYKLSFCFFGPRISCQRQYCGGSTGSYRSLRGCGGQATRSRTVLSIEVLWYKHWHLLSGFAAWPEEWTWAKLTSGSNTKLFFVPKHLT